MRRGRARLERQRFREERFRGIRSSLIESRLSEPDHRRHIVGRQPQRPLEGGRRVRDVSFRPVQVPEIIRPAHVARCERLRIEERRLPPDRGIRPPSTACPSRRIPSRDRRRVFPDPSVSRSARRSARAAGPATDSSRRERSGSATGRKALSIDRGCSARFPRRSRRPTARRTLDERSQALTGPRLPSASCIDRRAHRSTLRRARPAIRRGLCRCSPCRRDRRALSDRWRRRSCRRLSPGARACGPDSRASDTPRARRPCQRPCCRAPPQSQPHPVLAAADVVDQQPDRSAVVRHHDIGVAVVVDIAERGAATDLGMLQDRAGLSGDVLESPVAEIAEQLLGLLQRKRFVPRERFGRMPDRSVDGQDVQPAVVVEVEPGRAEARVRQARKPDARTRRPVLRRRRIRRSRRDRGPRGRAR